MPDETPKLAEFYDRKESYNIKEMIMDIQSKRGALTKDEMKLLYPDFASENPELFDKCCRDVMSVMDMKRISYMIELRRKVKGGEISYDEANANISVYMTKQYHPELLTKEGFAKK